MNVEESDKGFDQSLPVLAVLLQIFRPLRDELLGSLANRLFAIPQTTPEDGLALLEGERLGRNLGEDVREGETAVRCVHVQSSAKERG